MVDYAVFASHFNKVHTRNFFFDLKDKNYKKARIKGGVDWMKNMTPLAFLWKPFF